MSLFQPLAETSRLPDVGEGYERATLDLKLKGEVKKGFHLAKDVAAFANHLGGTLLIGAKEKDGRVDFYVRRPRTTSGRGLASVGRL